MNQRWCQLLNLHQLKITPQKKSLISKFDVIKQDVEFLCGGENRKRKCLFRHQCVQEYVLSFVSCRPIIKNFSKCNWNVNTF